MNCPIRIIPAEEGGYITAVECSDGDSLYRVEANEKGELEFLMFKNSKLVKRTTNNVHVRFNAFAANALEPLLTVIDGLNEHKS